MQTHGTRNDVPFMVQEHTATLVAMPPHASGWRPVVFVGRVSARRYMVGTAYQPEGVAVGAACRLPHMNDFIGEPLVAAVG